MDKKFPASVRRRMYFSHDSGVGGTTTCPRCKGPLEQEYHTYLVGVEEGGGFAEFLTGNTHGHFCAKCPVVVLDFEGFLEVAKAAQGYAPQPEIAFAVIGMVDLEAVPKDRRHLPFDDENNPIPIVPFLDVRQERLAARKRAKLSDKRKRHREHRRKEGKG